MPPNWGKSRGAGSRSVRPRVQHHPEPTALIEGHGNRLGNIRLTGARVDFKKGGIAAISARRSAPELIALLRPRELEAIAANLKNT